jgi:hypothetical protein
MAVTVTVNQVLDLGNDNIQVTATLNGTAANGRTFTNQTFTVNGWKSALNNPPGQTAAQKLAYVKGLIQAQNPDLAAPAPVDMGISG